MMFFNIKKIKTIPILFILLVFSILLFTCVQNVLSRGVNSLGGGSGSGESINYLNGNMILNDTDVFLQGKGIPVRISRTYNSQGYNAFEMIMLDYDHKHKEVRDDFKLKYEDKVKNLATICQVVHINHDAASDVEGGINAASLGLDIITGDWIGALKSLYDLAVWFRDKEEGIENEIALFVPKQWEHCVNGVVGIVGFHGRGDGEAMDLAGISGYGSIPKMDRWIEQPNGNHPMNNLFLILEGGTVVNFKRDGNVYHPLSRDVKMKLFWHAGAGYVLKMGDGTTFFFSCHSEKIHGRWCEWYQGGDDCDEQDYYVLYALPRMIKDKDGNSITINREGGSPHRITSVIDTCGRTITFANHSAVFKEIVLPDGRRIGFYYQGPEGLLSAVVDPTGRTTKYSYARFPEKIYGRYFYFLNEVKTATGGKVVYTGYNRITQRRIFPNEGNLNKYYLTTYSYHGLADSKTKTTYVTYQNGRQDMYTYQQHEVRRWINDAEYVDKRFLLEMVNAGRYSTTFYEYYSDSSVNAFKLYKTRNITSGEETRIEEYDEYGNPTEVVKKISDDKEIEFRTEYINVDNTGQDVVNGLYLIGNVEESTVETSDDTYTTTYEYDEHYNIKKVEDPAGRETEYFYNNDNKLIRIRFDEKDTELFYDTTKSFITEVKRNNITVMKKTVDSQRGIVLNETDAKGYLEGYQVDYQYDILNRVQNITYPDGTVYHYNYTDYNPNTMYYLPYKSLVKEIIKKGGVTYSEATYYYNGINQLVQLDAKKNGTSIVTKYTYGPSGQMESVTDNLNRSTFYFYDRLDRLQRVQAPDNTYIDYSYNIYQHTKTVQDMLGNSIQYKYDLGGNLIQVKEKEKDGKEHLCEYEYNDLGDMTKVIIDKEGRQMEKEYEYDILRRLKKVSYPADGKYEEYEYDTVGNIISSKDKSEREVQYQYDHFYRLTNVSYPDTGDPSLRFRYDIIGNRTYMQDGIGATEYKYDQLSRITNVRKNIRGHDYITKYKFEELNKLRIVYPNGLEVNYDYNKLGQLDQVKTGSDLLANYNYDKVGNLISVNYRNGAKINMAYDDLYRVNSIISYDSKDKMIFKKKYSYDTVGNIIRKERSAKESIHYQYDNKYQLTGVEFQLGGKLNYAFDTMGNRTNFKYTFGEKKYEYDEMNKLKKIWSKPKGITTFDYDIEGNVVKETKFHKNKTQIIAEKQYMFNLYNQLTEINIPQKNDQNLININGIIQGDKKVKFVYSGDGVRIEKEYIVEGVETKTNLTIFHYDLAGNLILETDKQGTAKNAYIYGNGMLICRYNYQELLPDNQELFYHYENTGSIVRITDKSGKQVQKYEYDPYGNIIEAEGTIHDNPFRYSQKYYDIETGLYYYGARYYNPEYGRWLSEDPITANVFNWRDNNPYQFCYNNPNIFTDVWGMSVDILDFQDLPGGLGIDSLENKLKTVAQSGLLKAGKDVGSETLKSGAIETVKNQIKKEIPKQIVKQTVEDIAENTLFDFIKKQALMTGLKEAGKELAKNTLSGVSQSGGEKNFKQHWELRFPGGPYKVLSEKQYDWEWHKVSEYPGELEKIGTTTKREIKFRNRLVFWETGYWWFDLIIRPIPWERTRKWLTPTWGNKYETIIVNKYDIRKYTLSRSPVPNNSKLKYNIIIK